jgi:hypothetical protein
MTLDLEISAIATPKIKEEIKLTIGSDPELSFAKGEPKDENYYDVLQFMKEKRTIRGSATGLGTDGSIAEIRAKESENPLEHCNKIKECMKELITMNMLNADEDIEGYAGNGFSPIHCTGGHIHFGFVKDKEYPRQVERISKMLDLLAIFLMPLEEVNSFLYRRKRGYGTLNNWRYQPYGMEYCTIGNFFYSYEDMASVFCVAYVLGYEALNNPNLADKIWKDVYGVFGEYEINPCYGRHEESYFIRDNFNFYEFFKGIVRSMAKYNDYKEPIERLFKRHTEKRMFQIDRENGITKTWKFEDFDFEKEREKVKRKREEEKMMNSERTIKKMMLPMTPMGVSR